MPISAKGLTELEVLVVDDDPDSRDLIVFVLEEDGAKVTAVSSALEALQVLQQDKFSLLISDIGMPQMDGYMLMQEIRSWTPENGGQIPGIAVTAYAGEGDQQQALAMGYQCHLAKPIDPMKLLTTIAELIKI